MFIKFVNAKPIYWILASIISACLGVICHISGWEFLIAHQQMNSYAEPYNSRLYDMLTSGVDLFMMAALVLGVVGVIKIVMQITKNWKVKIIPGIVELLIFSFVGFSLLSFTLITNEYYRMRRVISNNLLFQMIEVGNAINQYLKENNHMPDASNWSDSLINEPNLGVGEHDFHIGQLAHIQCNFAFNQNLSNLSLDTLEPNVVLLFEADGDLNLSGDYELMKNERFKDRYFLLKRQLNIYILFIDGSLIKYRLRDGAISKYDKDAKEFTPYLAKGKSQYSPLRWK